MNRPWPSLAKFGAIVALGCCPVMLHVALARESGLRVESPQGTVQLVDTSLVVVAATFHTLIYTVLLISFGQTLFRHRDPLVTALSRKMYGTISAEMAAYTRGVTYAWSCFFAAQLIASLLLYLLTPIYVWSLFVNVLDFPLVALMFAAEHTYRMTHLRDAPRHSMTDIVRMIGYIKDSVLEQASSR